MKQELIPLSQPYGGLTDVALRLRGGGYTMPITRLLMIGVEVADIETLPDRVEITNKDVEVAKGFKALKLKRPSSIPRKEGRLHVHYIVVRNFPVGRVPELAKIGGVLRGYPKPHTEDLRRI